MLDHNGPGHFGSSFALGFSEPNLCEKPTHPHQGRGSWRGGGPSRVQGGRGKVAQATGGHPGGKEILWATQAALGASGYVTVEDLAARENGFRDLGWGFNAQTSAFTAMRLLQAVRVAASLVRGGNQGDHPAGQAGPTMAPLEVLCDRRQLEDAYVATHGTPKPRLEFQGSDGYLKKQWRLIAKGELGYIPAEEGERPSSTHKKITVDGWDREDEEEVRSHPTSRRQLERLHLTFRTTLLMCTAALPQFGNLKVTKAELDPGMPVAHASMGGHHTPTHPS